MSGLPMFDVYVEGAKDKSAGGLSTLAGAIASRYKIPHAQVNDALMKGRFRVGKGMDQPTASRLAQQLEGLGAVTLIHPTGTPVSAGRPTQSAAPPSPARPPVPSGPALPPPSGLAPQPQP